jgi:phosphonate transport system substrate-binding protein
LSNTGRLYPLLLLEQAGTTPDEFFSRTFFTGSHDRSVEAVRDGLADAAAVDSLVFNALTVEPEERRRFKIVHTSPEFGMPPVVVSPRAKEADKSRIAACLLTLGSDEESKKILAGTGIERFVKPVSSWYDSVRHMRQGLKRAGLLEK